MNSAAIFGRKKAGRNLAKTFPSSLISLLFPLLIGCSFARGAEQPPNVVLIFADDLGYGDLGCYGATKVQTPNIDRLAKEGRRFTDAHSASAVCTPSRYGLLTGEYPLRANGGKGTWGPLPATSELIIGPQTLTIGKVFKNKGYATAALGKWHLGFKQGKNDWQVPLRPGPQDVGFDHYFGVPLVNSGSPFVYVEDDTIVGYDSSDPLVYGGKPASPTPMFPEEASRKSPNKFGGALKAHEIYDDEKTGTLLTETAVNWIAEKKDEPFFLYFPTPNIHHPFTPAPRFKGTSQCGLYGDFVHELDWMVGEILNCLEENGLRENTLVIFTSDNGGMLNLAGRNAIKSGHKINGDLLGFKFGVWEGGHRIPFIARWPGKIQAATQSDQLISQVDMLATFMALTDQDSSALDSKDSINMLPALLDNPDIPLRTELVLAPRHASNLAIRKDKWVYIGAQGSGGFTGSKPKDHAWGGPPAAEFAASVNSDIEDGRIKKGAPAAQLYDLESDPNQTHNVYGEYPDVVKEMSKLLAKYAPPKQNPRSGSGNPRARGKPAPKTDAMPSSRSACFDFESGKLEPWKVIEGEFGHVIGSRAEFFRNQKEYNKQGTYYLTTLEASADAVKGTDQQTGVIVSPLFVAQKGTMTFRIGGGSGPSTYAALCTADGKEVQTASGINDQIMQKAAWDLTPYIGQKMFIKVVDHSTTGWGHVTVDNFQFDAEVLPALPEQTSPAAVSATPGTDAHRPAANASQLAEQPNRSKPNFVLIFTDDQGYADLSCFGGRHVNTPYIDQIAKEGTKLTSFYVAAPLCTPSRAALMTGCYPKRIDMAYGSDFAVLLAADKKGLNPEEVTIAEVLKSAGYKTGIFGKWHLGDQPAFLPTRQGFDEYFGIPYSHDIHPQHPKQSHFKFPPLPLLDNEKVIEMDPDADYLTRGITQRAVSFINANKDESFFLYVPHPIPHAPLHVSPPFMVDVPDAIKAKLEAEKRVDYVTRRKLFRSAISEIDWSVGQILDALKKNGIDENTVIMFTSDNGPAIGKATPLRGRKGSTFEGGMREPTVIRWPGKIPANQVNDEIMTAMDLLPTFAKLAGAKIPTDRTIDGKDIWPTIVGESGTPHESFFYYRDNTLNAVRSGKWKLHVKDGQPTQLCDLENDIGEEQDLIKDYPEVVKRLHEFVKTMKKDIAEDNRPAAFIKDPKPLTMKSKESLTAAASSHSPSVSQTEPIADRAVAPGDGATPNFVVIFADDLGYGDISCYGATGVETPHLDALAAEGFRSTDFFVPANVCSPSRAALLTGRYPMRCGIPVARNENVPKYKNYGFAADEITIPELLKPAGYRSLMVGKWHLGMEVDGSHPLDAGFDEHLGIPSNYEPKRGATHDTLYRGKIVEQKHVRCQELTKRYTDEVVEFIGRQKDNPFFIYVSHHIVHNPLLPSKSFVGTSKKGKYGDFIKELDQSTGRIMKAIRDAGLDDNTLVVFTSDNGPTRTGSSGALSGGKYCTMEGGHRVPGIFRWPGRIPPNQVSDVTLTSMDLLPLFCKVAGVMQPDDRKIDGKNILPILEGNETDTPHKLLYYYNGTNLQAVREGDWKLHLPRTAEDQPFWSKRKDPNKGFVTLSDHRLFNLSNDAGETRNVADQNSEVVARIQKLAESVRVELGDVRTTGTDQRKINLVDPQER